MPCLGVACQLLAFGYLQVKQVQGGAIQGGLVSEGAAPGLTASVSCLLLSQSGYGRGS